MKKKLNNQKGFTLVEIIAVLLILGILAAMAVPKYIAIQADARNSVLKGAVAAALSQAAMTYSQVLLSTSGDSSAAWTNLNATTICNSVTLDGYSPTPTWNCTKVGNTFKAVITSGTDASASGTYTRPTS